MRVPPDPLKPFLWKARVLVVSAPSPGDAQLLAQDAALDAEPDGQAERELSVIRIVGTQADGGVDAQALRERLSMPPDRFEVALVGKDGGVAHRQAHALPLAEVFARIDAMPMRRAEIRKHESRKHESQA